MEWNNLKEREAVDDFINNYNKETLLTLSKY